MNKHKMVLFGFLLLLLLAACQNPPSTSTPTTPTSGTLLSERSQVYFSDDGGAAQEIAPNRSKTAGDGDEIWTASQGRALLKFVDLWLRLYGDSGLQAQDVTPASVKAALGQGAALVGATPGVYDRIEIIVGDPPHARVVLAGTLIMIAHAPDERITLVRSFVGTASVASTETDERVTVKPEEWAIVWPGNEIESTQDEDFIRQLTRELDFWDRFREIELDAGEFGPSGARVPSGNVPQVFVQGGETECPEPEVGLELASQRENEILVTGQAQGGCPSGGIIRVELAWGDGGGDELELDGGQRQTFRFTHRYEGPGDYAVLVRAFDARDRVASSKLSASVAGGATLPDLQAHIVSAPEEAGCGQSLGDSVQIEVINVSDVDAGQFAVGLYLSENSEGFPRTFLEGGREFVEGLAAGDATFVPLAGSNRIPTSLSEGARDYWLVAVADDTNAVQESDENDNIGTWRIRITCLK